MAGWLNERRRGGQKKRSSTSLHFPAGTKILDPERPSRRIYVLDSGHVRLSSSPEAIVDQLTPGAFFGEQCFLTPHRGNQIATALSPVVATAYRRQELLSSLGQDPRFAVRFLRSLALRLDRYEQTIRDFVTEGAEGRLARLLFRFTPQRPASGWVRLPLRATNVDLARMVGTTRWRVSSFLNHFQRLGWLSRRGVDLWIHREGLTEFLRSPP